VKIDTSQKEEYLQFVTEMTGTKNFGPCKTIAFINDHGLAVVLYNGQDEKNIGMSIAASDPRFCTRKMIQVAFGFPFLQLGMNRVTSIIRESNERSIRLCVGMGFTHEGVLRGYYGDEDALVFGLLKSECIWI